MRTISRRANGVAGCPRQGPARVLRQRADGGDEEVARGRDDDVPLLLQPAEPAGPPDALGPHAGEQTVSTAPQISSSAWRFRRRPRHSPAMGPRAASSAMSVEFKFDDDANPDEPPSSKRAPTLAALERHDADAEADRRAPRPAIAEERLAVMADGWTSAKGGRGAPARRSARPGRPLRGRISQERPAARPCAAWRWATSSPALVLAVGSSIAAGIGSAALHRAQAVGVALGETAIFAAEKLLLHFSGKSSRRQPRWPGPLLRRARRGRQQLALRARCW